MFRYKPTFNNLVDIRFTHFGGQLCELLAVLTSLSFRSINSSFNEVNDIFLMKNSIPLSSLNVLGP